MTSLLWCHLYLEDSQWVQYFVQQFLLQLTSVNSIASYEWREQLQQANTFKRQTLTFHFSTYRPNSFKHLSHHMPVRLHERIDCCDHYIGRRNISATRFFIISNNFSTMSKLFTYQTCIAGLVKHLSPYTGHISDWIALVLCPFAYRKRITEQNADPCGLLHRQLCHI